jgi:AraC family transcriptional regulator of adaptative response/methylated-DNA-[protein]-cysteine methyltransferase
MVQARDVYRNRKEAMNNLEIHFALGLTSLGPVLVAQSPHGVRAILLGDDPVALERELEERFPGAILVRADAELETLVASIQSLLEAPAGGLDVPLDPVGTRFQRRVWEALRDIPPGETATYTQIAARIGAPAAARAVARACAANALAVAIPCHRVVRGDGRLAGYRWGTERKRALLRRERAT